MGIPISQVTDAMRARMDSLSREHLALSAGHPNAALTGEEASARGARALERQEQRLFYNWLLPRSRDGQLCFIWQRTDKRTTGRIGQLDFYVFLPKRHVIVLEFKRPPNKLTPEQES